MDAILYVLKTGCPWKMLPHDFPPYSTVFWYFRQWRKDGTREKLNTVLRERSRVSQGREAQPSAAIIRQPIRPHDGKRGLRGYDAGKKVKGRKRQILMDTQGNLLKAQVHAADESDNVGGQASLERLGNTWTRLAHLWTDTGYKKTFTEWVVAVLGWSVECVKRPVEPTGEYVQLLKDFLGDEAYTQRYPDGFVLLPRRWVVERSLAWFSFQRRLAKAYEYLPETSETWLYIANARLTWKRLAKLKC